MSPDCSSQTITASAPTAQSYTISGAAVSYVIPAFSSSCSTCFTLCPVVYALALSDGSAFDSTLITFAAATRTVSIYSTDNAKSGSYTLKVTGYFTGMASSSYASATFTLTVNPNCATATITSSTLTSQTYTVASTAGSYVFPAFTSTCSACFAYCPVAYTLALSDGTTYDSTLITLTSASKTVTILQRASSMYPSINHLLILLPYCHSIMVHTVTHSYCYSIILSLTYLVTIHFSFINHNRAIMLTSSAGVVPTKSSGYTDS